MGFGQAESKERIISPGNYYIEKCLKMGILSVFCYAICDTVWIDSKLLCAVLALCVCVCVKFCSWP